ncbi:zinc finger protein 800-like, partial [Scleropages formosus]
MPHPRKVILVTSDATPSSQQSPTKNKYCQTEQQQHGPEPSEVWAAPKPPGIPFDVDVMEPGDPPLLQKQLHTSKSGIQQIIECFRSGTAELKRILLKEVDTIFECRQCRSLFRGLPNLVTHKEFYCFTRPNETDDTCPEKQCQAVNELLKAIYPQTDMTGYTVQLEPIEGNQNAVFQTLTTEHNQNQHAEQNSSKQEPATGPVSVISGSVEQVAEENLEQSGDSVAVAELGQETFVNPKGQEPKRKKPIQETLAGPKGKRPIRETLAGPKGKKPTQETHVDPTNLKPSQEACVEPTGKQPNLEARVEPTGKKPNLEARVEPTGKRPNLEARVEPTGKKPNLEARVEPTGQKPSYETCVEPKSKCKTKRSKPAPSSDEEEECNKEGTTSKEEKVRISCCLCGKEFSTRRSVGHHCLKVHKKNIEELRKCTETHTVPVSLVSIVQNQSCGPLDTVGYDCSVCNKSFTTEVGMRRHFDKEHHSLPQDAANKPTEMVSLKGRPSLPAVPEAEKSQSAGMCCLCRRSYKTDMVLVKHMHAYHKIAPAKCWDITSKPHQSDLLMSMSPFLSGQQNALPQADKSLSAHTCLLCKRNIKSKMVLIRHMRVFHKIHMIKGGDVATKPGKLILRKTTSATSSQQDSCPQAENRRCSMCKRTFKTEWVLSRHMRVFHKINAVKKRSSLSQRASNAKTNLGEVEDPTDAAKDGAREVARENKVRQQNSSSKLHKSKLELVFDLEQHYCKLCKRQFSSRANLNKHIGLHLDGNNLFIKFFPCPQCSYETRRKRDVLRHLSVVHKKPSHYLEKVTARLDSQVIKKPASVVLKLSKKRAAKQVAATSVTRSGALATRKREVITRSSSTLEATKVRVTKDLSLYTCDLCGRAFARKSHLQSHRRSHRAPSLQEQSGRRTRSKADL